MDDFSAVLSSLPLFRETAPDRISEILESAGAGVERCGKGALIRMRGDRYDRLLFVVEGCLEARFDEADGRSLAVEEFRAPSAVASAVLVSSEPVLPVSLVAREASVLVTVGRNAVLEMMGSHPEILKAFLRDAGDKVRFLAEKLRLMRFGTLRRRIAGHLLDLAAEQGSDEPKWRYGRERTADLLGAARPSLSREIAQMAEDGLLEPVDRHRVRVSVHGLTALIEE